MHGPVEIKVRLSTAGALGRNELRLHTLKILEYNMMLNQQKEDPPYWYMMSDPWVYLSFLKKP